MYVRAIRERRFLRFRYNGLTRVVIPAAYGHTASGDLLLRAYQVDGGTHSSTVKMWRSFDVARIDDCAVLDEVFFGSPPGYRRDRGLARVVCQL